MQTENSSCFSKVKISHSFDDFNQGRGAGTQISGSGSGSTHLNFLGPAPAPTSKSFWLRLQNDLVQWKLKNIVFFVQLTCPIK